MNDTAKQAADLDDGSFPDIDDDAGTTTSDDGKSFEDIVNETVGQVTKDDDGKLVYPDNISPELKFAVNAEIRYRNTQSSFEKTQNELRAEKAKATKLEAQVLSNVSLELSDEQVQELADLKATDQDAWRNKLNEYEQEAQQKAKDTLKETSKESAEEIEMEERTVKLEKFLEANPELDLSDEVVENDLPPRILKKLDTGESTFDEFLEEAKEFLTRGTKIKGADEEDDDDPASNLNKSGGGDTVSDEIIGEDIQKSYKDEIF